MTEATAGGIEQESDNLDSLSALAAFVRRKNAAG